MYKKTIRLITAVVDVAILEIDEPSGGGLTIVAGSRRPVKGRLNVSERTASWEHQK